MRGRRTFRYPTEDSDNSASQPEEFLDEEEQEILIKSLDDENARTNQIYMRVLLIISFLSILPYLRTLFYSTSTLFSILGITSLLSTAYLLVSLPPGQTNIAIIDRFSQSSIQKPITKHYVPNLLPSEGPIKQILPYLNVGLCISSAILGTLVEKKVGGLEYGLCFIPIINYGAVLITACLMGSINPEQELNTLKYKYKGA
ncbi:hypothetical protein HI914_01366 [Erysiphe necator]|nr:hypothetical protein HI914_01366 [Erysiphe necator]